MKAVGFLVYSSESNLPKCINFAQSQYEGVPLEIYDHCVRGGTPAVWAPPEMSVAAIPLDSMLLFHDGESVVAVGTVNSTAAVPRLRDELWPDSERLCFLSHFARVNTDLDDIIAESRDLNDPVEVVDLKGLNSQSLITNKLLQLSSEVERRRIYRRVGGKIPIHTRLMNSMKILARAPDTVFDWVWRLKYLKRVGKIALFYGAFAVIVSEMLCIVSIGSGFSGRCNHLANLSLVENMTTFSFSLVAFLLVSTAVVVGISRQRLNSSPNPAAEIDIQTVNEVTEREMNPNDQLELTRYKANTTTGTVSVDWIISSDSPTSIQAIRWQPDSIEPSNGIYEIWDARSGQSPSRFPAWRLRGSIYGPDNSDITPITHLIHDREIDWWISSNTTTDSFKEFRTTLSKAVKYSISSSVLGVAIQSYPWLTSFANYPWLTILTPIEHLFYSAGVILFVFISLGMIWTSVDLVNIMVELNRTE